MKINAKKKEVKKNLSRDPPASHRQDMVQHHNFLKDMNTNPTNTDFKSHSLKNSQSIKRSKVKLDDTGTQLSEVQV